MRKILPAVAVLGLVAGSVALWAADWPSSGGNPQRDGWSQGEKKLSKESAASKIVLAYTYKFENKANGAAALTAPIVHSNIIGYLGFKQLTFVGASSDVLYAIDSDLGKPYFKANLAKAVAPPSSAAPSLMCPGGLTAGPAFAGNSGPARGFGPFATPAARIGRVAKTPPPPPARGFGGFGGPGAIFAVGSDGNLHNVREQDGNTEAIAPMKFVPANTRVSGLNVNSGWIYASTVNECGGAPNGIYGVKISDGTSVSLMTGGTGASGSGGTAVGTDNTIYAQVATGKGTVAGDYNDTVLSLKPETLEVTDYFTPSDAMPAITKGVAYPNVTPTVFGYKDKDFIVTGGRDGRIYILDGDSLGGSDHHTPLYRSDVVVTPDAKFGGNGIWNSFSTALDADGTTRWLYASIKGPAAMKFPVTNGAASNGSIVAFKITLDNDKPALSPQWMSADMMSPEAPATANGLVFALSSGRPTRVAKEDGTPYTVAEWEKMAKPATLLVLDSATGKTLFTSGSKATTYSPSGLAVANSLIYFTTHDNTMYVYGIPLEK